MAEAGRQQLQFAAREAPEEKYFTVRLLKHWCGLPRDTLGPPSFKVSRGQWNKPGAALAVRLALLWAGGLQRAGLAWILLLSHRMPWWNGEM